MSRWIAPMQSGTVAPGPIPRFSVLVPAYNAAATVAAAVQSALAQSSPPHEVIVCDDGSTDGTQAALEAYRGRVSVLHKNNGGGASALNTALRAATGDFVAVLDADDAYLPGRLAALEELAAARPDLDIVTTDALFEVDGRRVARFNSPPNEFPAEEQRLAILDRCFLFAPAVRRERLITLGGWDESFEIAYDWDCWMRLILTGACAGSVDEPFVLYRLHDSSLSARRADSLRERLRVLEKNASALPLTDAERAVAEAALGRHGRIAMLAEAHEAVRAGSPDARGRLAAIGRERAFGRRIRLRAVALAATPAPVRLRLLRVLGLGARSDRRQVPGR